MMRAVALCVAIAALFSQPALASEPKLYSLSEVEALVSRADSMSEQIPELIVSNEDETIAFVRDEVFPFGKAIYEFGSVKYADHDQVHCEHYAANIQDWALKVYWVKKGSITPAKYLEYMRSLDTSIDQSRRNCYYVLQEARNSGKWQN